MQIKALHKNVYKLYAYARTQECLEAYRQQYRDRVQRWEAMKAEGLSDVACRNLAGFSRASYSRAKQVMTKLERGIAPPSKARKRCNKPRWGEAEMQLVLRLRRENPSYGKDKLAVILKRDHATNLSTSMVGRILKALSAKGLVQRSVSALRIKRKRDFRKGHARPWTYKLYKDFGLGERVQIDHMTVTKNGVTVKHFQAWERLSKHLSAEIYGHAKSSSATKFLDAFLAQAPFPVRSIQVDGGSEFMADFEAACAKHGLELIVLPPSRPTYNGGVERGNRTFKEEFYYRHDLLADSLGDLRFHLAKAVHKYNSYRPHNALNGLTPLAYIASATTETQKSSHKP